MIRDADVTQTVEPATILLVEDEREILYGLVEYLTLVARSWAFPAEFHTAENARQALALLNELTPDLIVSDINMPELDGYDFLTAVRRRPQLVHTPFVFLTARVTEEEIVRGRRAGVERYICKPFVPHELAELLRAQVTLSRQRRQRRRELEARLRRAMLLIFQHEFRTPASFVFAYAELLRDSFDATIEPEPALVHEFVDGIRKGGQRLLDLLQLLRLAVELRADDANAGGAYLARARAAAEPITDLPAILEQAVDVRQGAAAAQGIRLRGVASSQLPPVFGDRGGIALIVGELLDNALKFTAAGSADGEITLTASADDTIVELQVADTGVGFPPRARDALPTLFYQHDRARLEQQGAGVGLYVVDQLVRIHNGTLRLESSGADGCTATVRLPIFDPATSPTPLGSLGDAPAQARILVVEDEPAMRHALLELLQQAEPGRYAYDVTMAANGKEALAWLHEYPFDLIVTDVKMPEMDGYTLFEKVRERTAWLEIPFIFLSATHTERRALRAGVEAYIDKPYSVSDLIATINVVLERAFARRGAADAEIEALKFAVLDVIPGDFEEQLHTVQRAAATVLQNLDEEMSTSRVDVIVDHSTTIRQLVLQFTQLVGILTGTQEKTGTPQP